MDTAVLYNNVNICTVSNHKILYIYELNLNIRLPCPLQYYTYNTVSKHKAIMYTAVVYINKLYLNINSALLYIYQL